MPLRSASGGIVAGFDSRDGFELDDDLVFYEKVPALRGTGTCRAREGEADGPCSMLHRGSSQSPTRYRGSGWEARPKWPSHWMFSLADGARRRLSGCARAKWSGSALSASRMVCRYAPLRVALSRRTSIGTVLKLMTRPWSGRAGDEGNQRSSQPEAGPGVVA